MYAIVAICPTRRAGSAARPRSRRSRCGARRSARATARSRRASFDRCPTSSPAISACSTRPADCTRRRRRGADLVKSRRGLRSDQWVGWKPNGIGEQKPNHYGAIVHTIWENRRELPYAMRILRKGVCDGCALGVAGFHDWTISGVHLCTTRLDLLKLNTAGAIDDGHFADVDVL